MRWASQPVAVADIEALLGPIADRIWVVSEAASRAAGTVEGARALIEYGLRETEKHCSPSRAGASQPIVNNRRTHSQTMCLYWCLKRNHWYALDWYMSLSLA